MGRRLFMVGVALLGSIRIVSAQSGPVMPSKDEIQALLTRAYNQTNLWSVGAPAFHLRAKTKAYGAKGAAIEGTYELWWASKDRWREDISWSGAASSQIAAENQMWMTGEDTHRADSSRVTNVLRTWQGLYMDIAKVKIQSKQGASGEAPTVCISGHKVDMPAQTICLDPVAGSLSETQLADQHWEYSDYVNVSAKRYPRRIRYLDSKDPIVEVNVEALEPLNVAQTVAFAPPSEAATRAWCSDMVKPSPTHFDPSSPIPRNYIDLGMVVFTVDEKGHVTDVRAYQPGGLHTLDKNQKRTLMQNMLKPGTCHGTPVPSELVVWH